MKTTDNLVLGLTHVDLGWKKGRAEMAQVLDAYLERLCALMDENPELHYLLEQALHYRDLEKRNPSLFARVKALVRSGRLEFATGLASTIENNVTNGESFLRNMELGLRWLRGHMDVEAASCAMVDTFGFPPQMPQVLRQFGFPALLANRLGGRHGVDVFRARGLDGSEIVVAGRDCMSPYVKPGHIHFRFCRTEEDLARLFGEADENPAGWTMVMPYTENEIWPGQSIVTLAAASKKKYRFGTLSEYLQRVRELPGLTETHGDLNPEFTGTFSLRQKLRLLNRRAETLLLEAESACVLWRKPALAARLEEHWWEMAYIQFHDILTGSHPTAVYEDCLERLGGVMGGARAVLAEAAAGKDAAGDDASAAFTLLNTLPYPREDEAALPLPEGWAGAAEIRVDGAPVRGWRQEGTTVYFSAPVPPMAAAAVTARPGPAPVTGRRAIPCLENEYLRLEMGNGHLVGRLVYKPANRTILQNADDLLVLQGDMGNFQIEEPQDAEIPCGHGVYGVSLYEEQGVQKAVVTGSFPPLPEGDVTYRLTLALHPGESCIRLQAETGWQAEAARLRLKLSTPFQTAGGIYEVPFGAVERRPRGLTRNTRGEWAAHRFVAMEDAAAGVGLALCNQGTAGVECAGGSLWTTLLRSPVKEYAGMMKDDTSSDRGAHTFSFLLAVYAGSWAGAGVPRLAQRFNHPLSVLPGAARPLSPFAAWEDANLMLSSLKYTQDGRRALRIYETAGRETKTAVRFSEDVRAWRSDVREMPLDPLSPPGRVLDLAFAPFEIKTILLD